MGLAGGVVRWTEQKSGPDGKGGVKDECNVGLLEYVGGWGGWDRRGQGARNG